LIDGAGYLGASTAPLILGIVAQRVGVSAVFDVFAVVALIAVAVSGGWTVVVFRRRA
jgi:hypothetical protein